MDKGLKEVYDGIKNLITITEKIAEHTEDIAEIKDKVGKNTEDIAEIKGRAGAIEGRLDSVDTELISLKVGQKEMGTDIRVIKDRLEVKEEIYALKERLSAVEAEMGKGKA